jgi:hypothetical protein
MTTALPKLPLERRRLLMSRPSHHALPLADQLAAAWRELKLRRRLYPEAIRRGTLSEPMAARRLTLQERNSANSPWL